MLGSGNSIVRFAATPSGHFTKRRKRGGVHIRQFYRLTRLKNSVSLHFESAEEVYKVGRGASLNRQRWTQRLRLLELLSWALTNPKYSDNRIPQGMHR